MSTHIILLRHGETDWNAQRRIQGQTDTALNEQGHRQARARDSVSYLTDARGLIVVALLQLRERHLGMFQGYTGVEAQACWPEDYARYRQRDAEQTLGNGESLLQLFAS
ncbi:MAG: histidine phosphatase family protein [Gallionella sp.]|nr:histidine phosphatase family protein [Gallionella sp.]